MANNDDQGWKDWEEYNRGLQGTSTGSAYNQQGLNDRRKNGGGGSCFPGDAMVLTPFGWKEISTIYPGDMVLTFGKGTQLNAHCVRMRKEYGKNSICLIHIANNSNPIRITASHTILTQRGWCKVSKLKSGDELYCFSEKRTITSNKVVGVEISKSVEEVFNLIVDGKYTFVVQGCIAHSFTFLRRFRTGLHLIGDFTKKISNVNYPEKVISLRSKA
jgi:Pretoxin HINT domain